MTTFQNDQLESIEYLRNHANITYAEAVDLLERFDGDVTACLIELERQGRIRDEAATAQQDYQKTEQESEQRSAARRRVHGILSTLLRNRVNIVADGAKIADFSVLFIVVLAILCPQFMLLAALLLLLLGYRYSLIRLEAEVISTSVGEVVRGTARSLGTLGRSVVATVRSLFATEQPNNG